MNAPLPPSVGTGYAAYEAAKARWIAEHPDALPAEYSAAMRRLADECGI